MFVSTVLVVVASLQLTSSAPLAAGATVDWRENGCLIDSWNRALGAWQFADETMTRSKCQSTCQSKGYSYAGLEAGTQCFCANWVTYGEWSSGAGAPAGDCDVPCSGNRTETCGGAFRLWTYKLATVSSLPAVSTSQIPRSSFEPASSASSPKPVVLSNNPTSSSLSKSQSMKELSSTLAKVTHTAGNPSSGTKSASLEVSASPMSSAKATSSPSSVSGSAMKPSSSSKTMAAQAVAFSKPSSNIRKGGLAWTSDSGTDWQSFLSFNQSSLGWTYDWNSVIVPSTPLNRLEFVPMAWGGASADGFARDSAEFSSLGVRALLSFNEPDQQRQNGGANMSPSDAASLHQTIFNSTLSSQYRIGSPAVARGSKWWMQQWLDTCAGKCAFDFVPLHYYGTDANDMIAYIQDFIQSFGKPVWVTEYACMDFGGPVVVCDDAQTMAFNKAVLDYMTNEPLVERYAAFGTFTSWASGGNANGMMTANGTANNLGTFYAGPH